MKYFLSLLLALVFSYTSFSQVNITSQASCTSYTLCASFTGITPVNTGLYSDDSYTGIIPIGFTFNFYGTPYTQLVIGENGMLTFNTGLAGGYDPWPISAPLLGNTSALNSVCAPWCDIQGNVTTPGQPIYYSTQGTAPNRTFAATWCGIDMFSCNAQWATFQIILYETSNLVETHIGNKTVCAGWNGAYAIIGVQNAAGTAATTAPGRDYPTVWSTPPVEAWRFTPNPAGTAYTVASIPYAPVPYASSTVYWYDSATHAPAGTGSCVVVSPSVTTTYRAAVLGCRDTTWGSVVVPAVGSPGSGGGAIIPANFDFTTHLGCNGDTVVLNNLTVPPTFHNYWTFGDGTPVDSTDINPVHVYNDAPGYTGNYTITLVYNSTYNPNCSTSYSLPVTFNHPIDAHITSVDTSLCWMIPINETGTTVSNNGPAFAWDFGNGATLTTNPADYTYPAPGNYTVKFTVTDTIGCVRVDSQHVHIVQVTLQTATHDTSICLSDSLALYSSVTIIPNDIDYTVAWTPTNNIGNATTSATNFSGIGDYVYTATATTIYPVCSASDTEAIHSYPPITLTNLTASQNIPWGSTIQLNADGAVYYTWAPSNGSLSNPNINDPVAAPVDSVTKYTVYGMSLYGCLDSASLTITMGSPMIEYVPSAFTPNGDGLNDVFRIINNTAFQRLVDFRVFNRWGQQVFQTANREVGWDGTWKGVPQDMGVYSYEITVGMADGTTKTFKGTVTLIR